MNSIVSVGQVLSNDVTALLLRCVNSVSLKQAIGLTLYMFLLVSLLFQVSPVHPVMHIYICHFLFAVGVIIMESYTCGSYFVSPCSNVIPLSPECWFRLFFLGQEWRSEVVRYLDSSWWGCCICSLRNVWQCWSTWCWECHPYHSATLLRRHHCNLPGWTAPERIWSWFWYLTLHCNQHLVSS